MATLKDMAFEHSLKRGVGKKAYENFMAGARAVMHELHVAYTIGGINTMFDCFNSFTDELNHYAKKR